MAAMPWGLHYQQLSTPADRWGRAARANWAFSASILLAVLVIVLPLIALLVLAGLVGVISYFVLSLISTGISAISNILRAFGLMPDEPRSSEQDGRENVRVIR